MTSIEWCLVIAVNGAIVGFGLWKARQTRRSVDWFLAAHGLPWWMVGLSMFATAVDSGDYVAVAGEAFRNGISYISAWWIGISFGWLTLAYIVIGPIYRNGMFTNAEYLEHRFGPLTRAISVFVQIQYRTNVLANVAFSLFLMFNVLTNFGGQTWWLVGAVALIAAIYASSGGLKSVAITDAMQAVVMLIASVVLWWTVWNAVGGWSKLEEKLTSIDAKLAHAMTHVGTQWKPGVALEPVKQRDAPAALVVIGWTIALTAYCVVNHSQAMQMLGARSEWDAKMAAVVAGAMTAGVMWFNVTLGLLGRAAFPDLASADEIFPTLVDQFLKPVGMGLVGVVMAGLLAAGVSTFGSIGAALAAVFTRDFYARFLVQRADDRHYLRVSRIVTFAVIAISFVYIPFLNVGMITRYIELTGVAVVPLLTIYMMGILTRVHRVSGTVGLLAGIACGLSRFADSLLGVPLPVWWTNVWWGYLWSVLVTAVTMLVTTLICGWAEEAEIQGLTFRQKDRVQTQRRPVKATEGTWLDISSAELPQMPKYPFPVPAAGPPWYKNPLIWAGLFLGLVGYLNLVRFW